MSAAKMAMPRREEVALSSSSEHHQPHHLNTTASKYRRMRWVEATGESLHRSSFSSSDGGAGLGKYGGEETMDLTRYRPKTSTERSRTCRKRQKEYEENLIQTIDHLRKEIDHFSIMRDLKQQQSLSRRNNIDGSCVRIIHTYFDMFKHGALKSSTPPNSSPLSNTPSSILLSFKEGGENSPLSNHHGVGVEAGGDQLSFLRAIADPDLKTRTWMGEGRGGTGWFQTWEMMSSTYPFLRCEVEALEVTGCENAPTVLARATTSTQLTREALELVFPHIAQDEALLYRLVGRHVRFPVKAAYHFSEDNLVVLTDVELDFVTAFYAILQNSFDVCKILPASNAYLEERYSHHPEREEVTEELFVFKDSLQKTGHFQRKRRIDDEWRERSGSSCSSTSSSTSNRDRLGIGFLLS